MSTTLLSGKVLPRILGTVALLFATDFGDYLESLPTVRECPKLLAILDNMIHFWIGTLTWSVVSEDPWNLTLDFFLVAVGATFIDLDHFLAAQSISPNVALHAPHRGMFHCTGFMLLISLFLYYKGRSPHLTLLLIVAFVPHHLRDAQRRGLYLIPFFPQIQTPPIPKFVVTILLPIFPWILNYFKTVFVPKLLKQLPYKVLSV